MTAQFLNVSYDVFSVLLECSAIDIAHTSKNLSRDLQRILEACKIENKILVAVSDNASNI